MPLRIAALFAVIALVLPSVARAQARERPNVVFILVDDLGYGDIGPYGVTDIRTPALDRLAREGVRLTDGYSNGPVCTPTRAGFITGRYQQRVGLEWAIFAGQKEPGLGDDQPSIAKALKGRGYATGLFGKWHLGYKPEFGPNAHGFDEFFGLLSGNVDHYTHLEPNGELDWYEQTTPTAVSGYSTDLITDRAARFIERHAQGREKTPFFAYVAFNAVHWPFQPPDRPDDRRTRATWFQGSRADYAKMLERVDLGVGRLLETLDRHGATRDTLVIFTSDNGGERLSRNAPLFHRKASLWEGGIRVPYLLRWPARLPAAVVSKQVAITMDMTATILAAAGVRAPAALPPDGIDLLPSLTGERPVEPRTLFWRIQRDDRKQRAARDGAWKFVRDGGIEMLFNLDEDPGERRDVGYEHPERLRALRDKVAAWEKDVDAAPTRFTVK